jgi:hypothetical protein
MDQRKVLDMFSKTKVLALLLSFLTVITLVIAFGRGSSGKASATVLWEYKVVEKIGMEPPGLSDSQRVLNQLGADGWELVQFIRNEGEIRGIWIFKRPK